MQKEMKNAPSLASNRKITSKWIITLNENLKLQNFQKKKIRENSLEPQVGQNFLHLIGKMWSTKKKKKIKLYHKFFMIKNIVESKKIR